MTRARRDQRWREQAAWPLRSFDAIRPGCHVLDVACWSDNDALWAELVRWLACTGPLVDIETFWVRDHDRDLLLVTGMQA